MVLPGCLIAVGPPRRVAPDRQGRRAGLRGDLGGPHRGGGVEHLDPPRPGPPDPRGPKGTPSLSDWRSSPPPCFPSHHRGDPIRRGDPERGAGSAVPTPSPFLHLDPHPPCPLTPPPPFPQRCPDQVRFFAGHMAWAAGAIEEEARDGLWFPAEISPALLFTDAPEAALWHEARPLPPPPSLVPPALVPHCVGLPALRKPTMERALMSPGGGESNPFPCRSLRPVLPCPLGLGPADGVVRAAPRPQPPGPCRHLTPPSLGSSVPLPLPRPRRRAALTPPPLPLAPLRSGIYRPSPWAVYKEPSREGTPTPAPPPPALPAVTGTPPTCVSMLLAAPPPPSHAPDAGGNPPFRETLPMQSACAPFEFPPLSARLWRTALSFGSLPFTGPPAPCGRRFVRSLNTCARK